MFTRELMVKVHAIARELEGDYAARLALAFRIIKREVATTVPEYDFMLGYILSSLVEKAYKEGSATIEEMDEIKKMVSTTRSFADAMTNKYVKMVLAKKEEIAEKKFNQSAKPWVKGSKVRLYQNNTFIEL